MYHVVRFQLSTAASTKTVAFWNVMPRSLVVDRCYRGAYCLHHHYDE
jgi:hypothetical protein